MEELVHQLNDLDKVFDGMIDRLSAIQNIWSMVSTLHLSQYSSVNIALPQLLRDSLELRRTLSIMKTSDSVFVSSYAYINDILHIFLYSLHIQWKI